MPTTRPAGQCDCASLLAISRCSLQHEASPAMLPSAAFSLDRARHGRREYSNKFPRQHTHSCFRSHSQGRRCCSHVGGTIYMLNICQLIVGSRDTFLFRVLEVGWFPGGVGRGIIAYFFYFFFGSGSLFNGHADPGTHTPGYKTPYPDAHPASRRPRPARGTPARRSHTPRGQTETATLPLTWSRVRDGRLSICV